MTQTQNDELRNLAVKELRLLDVQDLAKILGRAVSSIRSDSSRCPHSLPPLVRIPGARRLLWRREDVEAWLEEMVVQPALPPAVPSRKRPGRPRKTDQLRAHVRP